MRTQRWWACWALCLVQACSTTPRVAPGDEATPPLTGRLGVQIDATAQQAARSFSAAFTLRGDPGQGQLDLLSPLGTVMAQARWRPGRVVLTTPQGQTEYPDLDALTRQVLGESVPVAALFDWLKGRPWPDAPSTAWPHDGFEQLGWQVDLAHLDQAHIQARRAGEPVVTVRALLDPP